jgi:hypothetical protein
MRMSSDTDPALLSSRCVVFLTGMEASGWKSSMLHSRRLITTCRKAG